jgi:hypothetical protein
MIDNDKHDHFKILNSNLCIFLENCTFSFLNNQVKEAVFMLQRSCEKFSLNSKRVKTSNISLAAFKLKSIQIFENIIIDIMKFDKIYIASLFLVLYQQSPISRIKRSIDQHFVSIQTKLFFINNNQQLNNFHHWLILIIAYEKKKYLTSFFQFNFCNNDAKEL